MTYKDNQKKVIIRADDYGYSRGINSGILLTAKSGVVKAVSVMVQSDNLKVSDINLLKKLKVELGIHLVPNFDDDDDFLKQFTTQSKLFIKIIGLKPAFFSLHWSSKNSVDKNSLKSMKFAYEIVKKKYCANTDLPSPRKKFVLIAGNNFKATFKQLISIFKLLSDKNTNELIVHPGKFPDSELISKYTSVSRDLETKVLTSKYTLDSMKRMVVVSSSYGSGEGVS